jgi:subtilisin family serine protease
MKTLPAATCVALLAVLLIAAVASGSAAAGGGDSAKLAPLVRQFVASPSSVSEVKVWIFFADHGEKFPGDIDERLAGVEITERSRARRLARSTGALVDGRDLPVHPAYIDAVREAGCRVKQTSKYLNALSAYATSAQILALADRPFVRRIDRVQTSRRGIPEGGREADSPPPSETPGWRPAVPGVPAPSAPTLDYGPSWTQVNLINVIPLHDANVTGQGVLVAMLDTGFNRHHESLIHLDVVAEWDFINHDPVTRDEPGDPAGQHNHGTYTLSTLGGYSPGHLIGPAWEASFALAKTERVNTEIQQEEDDYVRALEWADSLGADVVSSSLGYFDWYTYSDMDGNTAVTTVAADIAAEKGIAVITAAGNEGPLPWPGIIAPSDGDSVIAVGAVDWTRTIASFSSRGPTFDGRIKPDICAQGVGVRCASPSDSLAYLSVGGTSLSTPLAAGAAALCLEMHPYWTPIDLRTALRASGDHAQNPNNDYGWGVIDAYQAALNGASGVGPPGLVVRSDITLFQNAPNPFIPSRGKTTIRFKVGNSERSASMRVSPNKTDASRAINLAIYDVAGRLVRRLFHDWKGAGDYVVEWDGLDDRGVAVSSSVYYYRLSAGASTASKKLVLLRQ